MTRHRENGTTTVEFAIAAAALFLMIFGVIEIGRAYFVYAMLDEVTRRAARLAVVCPVDDPAVAQMAVFNSSGDSSDSPLVNGLTPAHIVIDYIDAANGVVALPGEPTGFAQIRYVRARVVGYEHHFALPFVTGMAKIQMPAFETILPRESLGIPREGAITPC